MHTHTQQHAITFQIMMIELNWPWAEWIYIHKTALEIRVLFFFFMSWAGKKMFMCVGYK